MKKALCVFAALAITAVASASINLWITEEAPFASSADYFNKTEKNFLTGFSYTAGAPATVPVDMGPCDGGMEKTFFVWGSWVNEPLYTQVYGLHVCVQVDGCMQLLDSAIYRHSKTLGTPATRWTRWDQPGAIVMGPGCEGLGIAAAVTANGIMYFDNAYDLVANGGQDFLIGAFKVQCLGEGTGGKAYLGVGTLGIICNDENGNDYRPVVSVFGQAMPANPQSECFWVEAAYCTPEPASLLLIGLAGLFLRRR